MIVMSLEILQACHSCVIMGVNVAGDLVLYPYTHIANSMHSQPDFYFCVKAGHKVCMHLYTCTIVTSLSHAHNNLLDRFFCTPTLL